MTVERAGAAEAASRRESFMVFFRREHSWTESTRPPPRYGALLRSNLCPLEPEANLSLSPFKPLNTARPV